MNHHYFQTKHNITPGYVYLIQANNLFKIGKTKNVKQRLSNLQTSNPVKLNLIGVIETDNCSLLESFFHQHCSKYRTTGEWFNIPEDEIADIAKMFTIESKILLPYTKTLDNHLFYYVFDTDPNPVENDIMPTRDRYHIHYKISNLIDLYGDVFQNFLSEMINEYSKDDEDYEYGYELGLVNDGKIHSRDVLGFSITIQDKNLYDKIMTTILKLNPIKDQWPYCCERWKNSNFIKKKIKKLEDYLMQMPKIENLS